MANSRPGHLLKPTNCTEEELHFDWRRFQSFATGLGGATPAFTWPMRQRLSVSKATRVVRYMSWFALCF